METAARGRKNPKWHFGICYSTFYRLRTLTCHPSSGRAGDVKGEHRGAIGHCLCLPRPLPRGKGAANQHPAKRCVIGPVYLVLAWLHAWLDCRVPLDERGVRERVGRSVCARRRGKPCAKFLYFVLSLFYFFCQSGWCIKITDFVIEGFSFFFSFWKFISYKLILAVFLYWG